MEYKKIEEKWQKEWEKAGIFRVKEDSKKKKFTIIEMYPYPSSTSLHMGHARNYCIGDAYARFKRMNGFNVLYPMGYDSFGLPAENAAIKAKSHPKIFTEKAIKDFMRQQKEFGLSYDWDRLIMSHSPEYYKWDQWIFLKMLEKGLAYKKKASVNWCSKCNTVLANEQVHNGKCWRHEDNNVEVKEMEQWFFRITDYVEELLKGIDKLKGWPEDVKLMQRNWIGKSYGTLVKFPIKNFNEGIEIFTTRADTLFGVTFMVFAPEHPMVMELLKGSKYEDEVKKFINKVVLEDRFSRTAEGKEKEGMFIGRYAINPVTNEEIPIYIANFVLLDYGTGAIMAVPTHDQRDFEFAKKFGIKLKAVINPADYELNAEKMSRAYMGDGSLVNSDEFNGMNNREAIPKINEFLEKKKIGKREVQYKLRDWLISRQRFWGCPIPIVYCDKCGIVAVSEKDLPVRLPDKVRMDVNGNPLANCKEFVNVKCPKCKGKARRETDTMDTFVDSSWYFLRYCDPRNNREIFDKKKVDYWMPIDTYIGGKEHATMHLIYFRFFTKFLKELGLVKFDEPALKLFNQGMLHKNGVVMSKSKGNVVTQEEIREKYGLDTGRLFLLFVAGPDKDMEWSDEGIEGAYRIINKLYSLKDKKIINKMDKRTESKMNKTIMLASEEIENFKFNKAIVSIMNFLNYLYNLDEVPREALKNLILLMNPFAPHLSEELWERIKEKGFASLAKWPKFDVKKINKKLEAEEELIEKTLEDIKTIIRFKNLKVNKVYLYVIPNEIKLFESVKENYEKELNLKVEVYAVNDNKKYDPENKSKKAKPGKPGIFLE